MAVIRLTKEFSFEMAHTLDGYDGPCREIHGHSYRLFVTVKGRPKDDPSNPKYGMVIDFGDLKRIVAEQIVGRYDHALVMRRTESNAGLVEALRSRYSGCPCLFWRPSAERRNDPQRRAVPSGRYGKPRFPYLSVDIFCLG